METQGDNWEGVGQMIAPPPDRCQACLQHSSTSAFTPCNVLSPLVTNLSRGYHDELHRHGQVESHGDDSNALNSPQPYDPYLNGSLHEAGDDGLEVGESPPRSYQETLLAAGVSQDHSYVSVGYYEPGVAPDAYQDGLGLAETYRDDLGFESEPQHRQEVIEPQQARKRARRGACKTHAHYMKGRTQALQYVLQLPLKTRQLICVAEFYRHMALSSLDSPCKVTEAYRQGGESVGVSMRTARKWVDDWDIRGDGTFSESLQGKHVKVEWLLQPEHLQNQARAWIHQNCPEKGDPPGRDSIVARFRDFCNNDLLRDIQAKPMQGKENGLEFSMNTTHRKISTETARSWLHRLDFHNFKDYRGSARKSKSGFPDTLASAGEGLSNTSVL